MDRIIQGSESEFIALIRQAVREELAEMAKRSVTPVASKQPATKKEAAQFLGISMPTLDQLIRSGQLEAFNIGRSVRLRWSDIEAYVSAQSAQ